MAMLRATDDYATGTGCPQAGATHGSRPKKRKGKLYWRARAVEFPALRGANSVGLKRRFVSAKQGGHPLARVPALFV